MPALATAAAKRQNVSKHNSENDSQKTVKVIIESISQGFASKWLIFRKHNFYYLKHTSDTSWTQQYPPKMRFGTLRETLSKKNSQRNATKHLPARLWEATVSKSVPKSIQWNPQVVFIFYISVELVTLTGFWGLSSPQSDMKDSKCSPKGQKSTPGARFFSRLLQEQKSSQAATNSDTQGQRAQRTLHPPIAPRSRKTWRCGGVA